MCTCARVCAVCRMKARCSEGKRGVHLWNDPNPWCYSWKSNHDVVLGVARARHLLCLLLKNQGQILIMQSELNSSCTFAQNRHIRGGARHHFPIHVGSQNNQFWRKTPIESFYDLILHKSDVCDVYKLAHGTFNSNKKQSQLQVSNQEVCNPSTKCARMCKSTQLSKSVIPFAVYQILTMAKINAPHNSLVKEMMCIALFTWNSNLEPSIEDLAVQIHVDLSFRFLTESNRRPRD